MPFTANFRKRANSCAAPWFASTRSSTGESGFTLVETLIVILVMTIITGIVLSVLRLSPSEGRALYDKIHSAAVAVQKVDGDTGCYPSALTALYQEPASNQGIGACAMDLNHWNGPYLTGTEYDFTNGDIAVSSDITDESNSRMTIALGTWLGQDVEMQGREPYEAALVVQPVTASVQAGFCKHCGGCVPAGTNSNIPSMCFTSGSSVGYVFATSASDVL